MRSNAVTIRTWDLAYRLCARNPLYDDQTIFWLVLRTNLHPVAAPLAKCPPQKGPRGSQKRDNSTIVSCPLDNCMFSASHLQNFDKRAKLAQALKSRGDKAVMIHANWMNGRDKKKQALNEGGLWILQPTIAAKLENSSPQMLKQIKQQTGSVGGYTCKKPSGVFVGDVQQ